VPLEVAVAVPLLVEVSLLVEVELEVAVAVSEEVEVALLVAVEVPVPVALPVEVAVPVEVALLVAVSVEVEDEVEVAEEVAVPVEVAVEVPVAVGDAGSPLMTMSAPTTGADVTVSSADPFCRVMRYCTASVWVPTTVNWAVVKAKVAPEANTPYPVSTTKESASRAASKANLDASLPAHREYCTTKL